MCDENNMKYVEMYHNGSSVNEICRHYHIPKSTMYYWIHQYSTIKSTSENSVTMQKYTYMLRRLERLEQENQIFKLSNCTCSSPLAQKLSEIKRLKDQFSIRALCDVLQVRRSNFYHYLYRKPEVTQIEKEDVLYREHISHIFEQSQGRFGAKKIRIKLKEERLHVSQKRIQRLMCEMNLKCNRSKPKRKFPAENERQYYRNHVKQKFDQTAPNKVWAYEVCDSMSAPIVSAVFLEAFIRRNQPEDLIFHSDQGANTKALHSEKDLKN